MSVIQRRRARSTGAVILVLDNRREEWICHPDRADTDYTEFDANPWITICKTHGCLVHHPTRALAVAWSAEPESWCEFCADRSQ